VLAVTGITNKSLRALMTGLFGSATYTMNQARAIRHRRLSLSRCRLDLLLN
jgi:hypothetical protein